MTLLKLAQDWLYSINMACCSISVIHMCVATVRREKYALIVRKQKVVFRQRYSEIILIGGNIHYAIRKECVSRLKCDCKMNNRPMQVG